MDGLIKLGMKSEALRLARLSLRQNAITPQAFSEAMNAIQTLADKIKPWAKLVESAYERLPKRKRPAVRFWVMAFRNCSRDHEGVLRLMPNRLAGEFASEELVYLLESAFELGKSELIVKLAKQLPRAIREADSQVLQSQLLLCLAEYLVRKGKCAESIAVLEAVQADATFHRNAVTGIVEIHAVRAWLALRLGFQRIGQFNRNFDPETELTVPGNDKAVQEQAAKEFRRLQKTLEKILPEKRRKELGLP
jgi:hypothetical protein